MTTYSDLRAFNPVILDHRIREESIAHLLHPGLVVGIELELDQLSDPRFLEFRVTEFLKGASDGAASGIEEGRLKRNVHTHRRHGAEFTVYRLSVRVRAPVSMLLPESHLAYEKKLGTFRFVALLGRVIESDWYAHRYSVMRSRGGRKQKMNKVVVTLAVCVMAVSGMAQGMKSDKKAQHAMKHAMVHKMMQERRDAHMMKKMDHMKKMDSNKKMHMMKKMDHMKRRKMMSKPMSGMPKN